MTSSSRSNTSPSSSIRQPAASTTRSLPSPPGDLLVQQPRAQREQPIQERRERAHLLGPATLTVRGARDIVLHHHERWDGGGYPRGLGGQAIPFGARLFSLVDPYDAMTSDRPYRAAMPTEQALEEILRHQGSQFDPEMVEAILQIDRDRLLAVPEAIERQRHEAGRRSHMGGLLIPIAEGLEERPQHAAVRGP